MPPASQKSSEDKLLRTLIYGKAKTKKTWWACRAVEAGFNVLLLDGDDGSLIVDSMGLTSAQRDRLQIVDLVMRTNRTVMAPFFMKWMHEKQNKFLWDEQAFDIKIGLLDEKHSHYYFDLAKLTPNDVVIVDGWKALCESSLFLFASKHEIDLCDASKTEWTGYNFQGNFLNWVLARLHALPCHVVVIGHAMTYEKWDRRSKNPQEHKMLYSREQPISSSGPHGEKLASHFTDVLRFEALSSASHKIYAFGDKNCDGGSRLVAPETYDWDKLTIMALFDKLKHKSNGAPMEGAAWYPPGVDPRKKEGNVVPLVVAPQPSAPAEPAPVIENKQPAGGLAARLLAQQKK